MAPPKKNDYYDILNISPGAELTEVAEAIRHFREERDKSGNYAAIINKIEETLTDPELRVQYDFEHGYSGPKDSFMDIDESVSKNHHSTKPEHHKYDIRKELAEYSVLSDKNTNLGSFSLFDLRKIIIAFSVLIVLLLAFIFSKPLLDKKAGKEQAQAALELLKQTESQVENAIRESKIFPEKLNLHNSDSRFNLRLDTQRQQIVLTFSGDVVKVLRNAEMTNSFITQPNLTYWKCDIGSGFPAEYKPVKCF